MMKTGYWNKLLLVFVMTFTLGSCDLFELDINDDPNNPTTAAINLCRFIKATTSVHANETSPSSYNCKGDIRA